MQACLVKRDQRNGLRIILTSDNARDADFFAGQTARWLDFPHHKVAVFCIVQIFLRNIEIMFGAFVGRLQDIPLFLPYQQTHDQPARIIELPDHLSFIERIGIAFERNKGAVTLF